MGKVLGGLGSTHNKFKKFTYKKEGTKWVGLLDLFFEATGFDLDTEEEDPNITTGLENCKRVESPNS